jgi:hypothetical protein
LAGTWSAVVTHAPTVCTVGGAPAGAQCVSVGPDIAPPMGPVGGALELLLHPIVAAQASIAAINSGCLIGGLLSRGA